MKIEDLIGFLLGVENRTDITWQDVKEAVFNEIIEKLEELEDLKSFLSKKVTDEVKRLRKKKGGDRGED